MSEYLTKIERLKISEKILARARELSKEFRGSFVSILSGRTREMTKESDAIEVAKEAAEYINHYWEVEYDSLTSSLWSLAEDLRWRYTKNEPPEKPGKYQVAFKGSDDVFTDQWRAKKSKWVQQDWTFWRPLCPVPALYDERV